MNEQLLQDLVNRLRELVPVLENMGVSSTGKGNQVEKASVVFDRSSTRIVAAVGKLAAQLDKNTRGKKAEQHSLAQFVKEVERATDITERSAAEQAAAAAEVEKAFDDLAGAGQGAVRQTKQDIKTKEQAASKDRLNAFRQESNARSYAAIQAEEEARLGRSRNIVRDTLEKVGGENLTFQRGLVIASNAVEGLGMVAKSTTSTLADLGTNGFNSFNQLNSVVDSVAGAIAKLGASLPFVSAAAIALAEATKFTLTQIQQVSDNFRELSEVGALTADGMTGLRQNLISSGLTQQGLTNIIKQNSTAFTMLGGTVGDGTKQFTKFVGGITKTPLGDQLRNLGLSADAIGESAAAFVTLQGRLGATQRMTQTQLTEGTIRYTRELDAISKITGMERKELQGKMNAALSEQRFRAKMQEMERTGQGKTAERLNQFQAAVSKSAPGLAEGLRDIIAAGGAITTDAARQAATVTGGAITRIARDALDGKDVGESLSALQVSVKEGALRFEKTAQFADISGVVGNYAELVDFSTTAAGDLGKAMIDATTTVGQQAAGQDAYTNTVVIAQKQLELAAIAVQDLTFELVQLAVPALGKFGEVIADITDRINQELGTAREISGVPAATVQQANQTYADSMDFAGMPGMEAIPPAPGATPQTPVLPGAQTGRTQRGGAVAVGAVTMGATGIPAAGAAGGGFTADSLAAEGLRLRPSGGDIQQEGAAVSPKLIALAKQIQSTVPGFSHFTGFNDAYHQGRQSQHRQGQALDFVLNAKPSVEAGKKIVADIKRMGGGQVLDEYNFPSPGATGPHMHVGIPEFAKGGVATGPKSGYKAMLHGTEAVVPLPDGKTIPVNMQNSNGNNMAKQMDMMGAQLTRLDEMVSLMRRQVGVSDKMLRVSQS